MTNWNICSVFYQRAFALVGWQAGMAETAEVQKAENELNQKWLDCLAKTISFKQYKVAVMEWEENIHVARQKLNPD